jgi:hypothetical protein
LAVGSGLCFCLGRACARDLGGKSCKDRIAALFGRQDQCSEAAGRCRRRVQAQDPSDGFDKCLPGRNIASSRDSDKLLLDHKEGIGGQDIVHCLETLADETMLDSEIERYPDRFAVLVDQCRSRACWISYIDDIAGRRSKRSFPINLHTQTCSHPPCHVFVSGVRWCWYLDGEGTSSRRLDSHLAVAFEDESIVYVVTCRDYGNGGDTGNRSGRGNGSAIKLVAEKFGRVVNIDPDRLLPKVFACENLEICLSACMSERPVD